MQVAFPGWEDPLEEGTTTHSSILAWKVPWTEQPMKEMQCKFWFIFLLERERLLPWLYFFFKK